MCVYFASANGVVAKRSKASVNPTPSSAGVGSTPAVDVGETDWTSCGKVAIFCNLYAYGGHAKTRSVCLNVEIRDSSAHTVRDPTITVTKVQER